MRCQDRKEFDRCWEWLSAALEHGLGGASTHTKEDVWKLISNGTAQFFPFDTSAGVTIPCFEPKITTLNLWLAGGALASLRDEFLPAAVVYARDEGFERVVFGGRSSWGRALRGKGFVPTHTIFAMELDQ